MARFYRILHIDTDRTWRGGQQQVASLLKHLHALGQINFIASPLGSALFQRLSSEIAKACPISLRNEWDILSAFRLARIIQQEKIDVLHAHSGRAHTLGILARWIARKPLPLVVSRRVDFPICPSWFNRWKYRQTEFFLPISEAIAALLEQAGISRERMTVVYSSVDSERFAQADGVTIRREFSIPPDALIVGNIAVCEERKRPQDMIQAAQRVLQELPDTHFFLVGDGPLRASMLEQAHELGLDHRVHLPGFRSDIANFLACFDLFLLVPCLEGLGSSILDAQFFSLPVIATPVGGIPEIVQNGETGILVPVGDVDALASVILDLLHDSVRRKTLGQAARRRVEERFTAEIMARDTLAAYHKICS